MKIKAPVLAGIVALTLCVPFAQSWAAWFLGGAPADMRPNCWSWIIWLPVALATVGLRHRLDRLVACVLFLIASLGNINAIASFIKYGGRYRTDLNYADQVFAALAVSYVIGLLLRQWLNPDDYSDERPVPLTPEPGASLFMILMMLFPFVWIVDEVVAVGLPILSGASIADDIYALSYGKLYGLGLWVVMAAIALFVKMGQSTHLLKLFLAGVMLVFCAFLVFDGRRVFILVFVAAAMHIQLRDRYWREIWPRLLAAGVGLVVLYVALLYVRQGGRLSSTRGAVDKMSVVGVEFRDYSYVLTVFGPGNIPGYAWFESSVGSFFNTILLAIFGVDKGAITISGSAYSIAIAMHSTFGIRVGVLAELFLAYGWIGLPVAVVLGYLHGWILSRLRNAKTSIGASFWACIAAIYLLGHVGQSTVTVGYMSVLAYLWFIWLGMRALGKSYEGRPLKPLKKLEQVRS